MKKTVTDHKRIMKKNVVSIVLSIISILLIVIKSSTSVYAVADTAKVEVREVMKEMILTADETKHDILKYQMTYREVADIWDELENGECYDALKCHDLCVLQTTRSGDYVSEIYLYMTNAAGFEENYKTFNWNTQNILSGIDPDMKDEDIALYLHDVIDEMTTYKHIGYGAYKPCGPLVYGQAVCEGYATAYMYLLEKAGVQTYKVYSNSMNHAWNYVELDGSIYAIDATWDDTRYSGSTLNGAYGHKYFLKTDSEMEALGHYDLKVSGDVKVSATSDKYSDSFIHTVEGASKFYEGYWFYADGADIKYANLSDSEGTTVLTANGTVKLVDVKDGIITYMVGSAAYTYNLTQDSSKGANQDQTGSDNQDNNNSGTVAGSTEDGTSNQEIDLSTCTVAKFYLVKEGGSRKNYSSGNYISLGKGYIIEEVKIQDDEEAIIANLAQIPSYENYVSEGKRVQWYSIKKENDGWHVDGEIVKKEENQEPQAPSELPAPSETTDSSESSEESGSGNIDKTEEGTTENQPINSDYQDTGDNQGSVEETHEDDTSKQEIDLSTCTVAKFYLVKEGGSRKNYAPSNYINLGKGYIIEEVKIQDDEEAILANLAQIPSYESYVSEGKRVQWYSIKKENDGWHVDGAIVDE